MSRAQERSVTQERDPTERRCSQRSRHNESGLPVFYGRSLVLVQETRIGGPGAFMRPDAVSYRDRRGRCGPGHRPGRANLPAPAAAGRGPPGPCRTGRWARRSSKRGRMIGRRKNVGGRYGKIRAGRYRPRERHTTGTVGLYPSSRGDGAASPPSTLRARLRAWRRRTRPNRTTPGSARSTRRRRDRDYSYQGGHSQTENHTGECSSGEPL